MNPICNLGLFTNYLLMVVFIVQSQLSDENMFKYRKLFSAIIILYLVFQVSMNSLLNSAIVKHTANFMIRQTNALANPAQMKFLTLDQTYVWGWRNT
jgi:hypothetical protein